uniref:Uncharacterized protein n=1 Tax=viral metagenome TaxID=1070528 RepID=A0A6M3K2E3_9ZZZZ
MIKNLTISLPEYGKIKAGTLGEEAVSSQGKKFRLPKKLNHFVITTTARDEEGNLVLDTDLMEILKKSGNATIDADGNLTGIPIRLLYNNIDINFFTRYAAYVGGKCVCAGDGIKATTRDGRVKDCPCQQLDPTYQGKDKCKATGRLICVIEGSTVVGACHILRTTSINTVKSILGSLAFIQTAASGMLAFLPLHLILKPKTVTIPTTGQLTTVYVSSIIYRGSIENLRRDALGMAKDKVQYLLEMDSVEASAREVLEKLEESEQEQLEINQEFYPDTIDVTPSEQDPAGQKPEPEKEPETKPEPKAETKSSAEPPAEQPEPMVTKDQKREILALKNALKITDQALWQKMLEPYGVKSANFLTESQAAKFIAALKVDAPPF